MKKVVNKKNHPLLPFFIIPWFFLFFFITSAFAKYSETLNIDASAVIGKYKKGIVYINQSRLSASNNAIAYSHSRKAREIMTVAELPECNSSVTYDLDMINTMNMVAYVPFYTTTPGGGSLTGFDVIYSISSNNVNDSEYGDVPSFNNNELRIPPNGTVTISVTVKNNCTTDNTNVSFISGYDYEDIEFTSLITLSTTTPEQVLKCSKVVSGSTNTYENILYDITSSNKTYASVEVRRDSQTDNYPQVMCSIGDGSWIDYNPNVSHNTFGDGKNEYYYELDGTNSNQSECLLPNGAYCSLLAANTSQSITATGKLKNGLDGRAINDLSENTVTVSNDHSHIDDNPDNSATSGSFLSNSHPGYYLIELWGAAGGRGNGLSNDSSWDAIDFDTSAAGGAAGYVNAVIYLDYGEDLYYTLGHNGMNGKYIVGDDLTPGGANGGGNSQTRGGGGGGYSLLQQGGTTYLIAAGGGGGSARGSITTYAGHPGGAGGNINSSSSQSTSNGTIYVGFSGEEGNSNHAGTGGSTSGGYCPAYQSDTIGSSLQGGTSKERGGGGGAGYFGGGGGGATHNTRTVLGRVIDLGIQNQKGGGGGGSSFVRTGDHFKLLKSQDEGLKLSSDELTTLLSNGGAIHIQYIGRTY